MSQIRVLKIIEKYVYKVAVTFCQTICLHEWCYYEENNIHYKECIYCELIKTSDKPYLMFKKELEDEEY